ncbi:Hsp20/alpha crystallin family protein [candidate division KSB1 bacterium]|nr:Hsp20/alpha crystallin family protein [candidate division KSB1 bacterium]
MSLQIVRVIRELTDTGQQPDRMRRAVFCKDLGAALWEPNTDIVENQDAVFIRLELAGVEANDLCVKIKNGCLMVSGERKDVRPQKPLFFHQLELRYGPFFKSIAIPDALEHNPIEAHLKQGMLEIILSKKTTAVEIPISR